MNNKGKFALAQITLLVFGIIAFGWIVGSEARLVSGDKSEDYRTVTFADGKTGTYVYSTQDNNFRKIAGDGPFGFMIAGDKIYTFDQSGSIINGIELPKPSIVSTTYTVPAADSSGTPSTDYSGIMGDVKIDEKPISAQAPAVTGGVPVGDPFGTFTDEQIAQINSIGKSNDLPTDLAEIQSQNRIATGGIGTDEYNVVGGPGTQIPAAVADKPPIKWGPIWDNLGEGLTWSMYVVFLIQILGPMMGYSSAQTNAASLAAFGGIMAGKLAYGIFQSGGWGTGNTAGIANSQLWSAGIGIVVAALIYYALYKEETTEMVSFTCDQWQAPTGGSMCEQCNKQGILPCSEYQCRSLGQSCQLINPGTTEEKCTWVNRQDVTPPVISLWKDVLTRNHKYSPDSRVSPPDTGTKIVYEQSKDGCIKAFTPLEFGILTNEPASCKLDYQRKASFDNMTYYLGGTPLFLYNHSQVMSLPGGGNLTGENITMKNNGEYSLFIRCSDSNGNKNVANFVFRFCVDKGPDTTPPVIVATNLLNNMPIAYNHSTLDLEVYTNEPANCRWSHLDQNYEKMEKKMTCSSSVTEMNAQMLYKCKTKLEGIKNEVENKFYLRCQDQPLAPESGRNKNMESYVFTIIGTKPLVVSYVEPNGTIKDSTEAVKVTLKAKTLGGYQEGNSTCYYNTTGDTEGIMFFNTNSYLHSQDLWLPAGQYTYSIKCVDLGGNADTKEIKFKVETDTASPIVVRAYNEESNLKIITNEPSSCVYGTNDCEYDILDGIIMSSIDDNETQHYTSWDTSKTFYIKCKDKYGTSPYPNQCSIILKPSQKVTVQEISQ